MITSLLNLNLKAECYLAYNLFNQKTSFKFCS